MFSLRQRLSKPTALERTLGIRFKDRRLLQQALAHPSYHNENPDFTLGSYQRLEFLGDSVLGLAITRELFVLRPDLEEGPLTRLRSNLVKGTSLAVVAREIGLGEHIVLGRGEEVSGGRQRDSILAAALEALIGAVFVDRGYEAGRRFALKVMKGLMDEQVKSIVSEDPKSRLQQETQRLGWGRPHYRTVRVSGPSHAKIFRVRVETNGQVLGSGSGTRKVDAETEAARQGLLRLGVSQ